MKKLIPILFKFLSFINPNLAAKYALKIFMHPKRSVRSEEEMHYLLTGKQVNFASHRKARVWGEGRVIWLIHGWESRCSTFFKLIPLLIDKGFKVVAWDGPAHGDSPGDSSHVAKNARALSQDMDEGLFDKAEVILGHSFGGATLAVLNKIRSMPKKVVICSAPTRIQNIFTNFAKMIKLSEKTTSIFIQMAESDSGYSLQEGSLVDNDISKTRQVLVIHDIEDNIIPFSDFEILKKTWESGEFIATENLGHRLTIKNKEILSTIIEFVT
ncbi:MAG: alpha/beta fold hydrolase [Marinicellaceae bacterium]